MAARKKKDQAKKQKCKLCGTEFAPDPDQLPAYWAVNWCTGDSGLLCPPCHAVAEEMGAVSETPLPVGCVPFGSDIMAKSSNVSKEDWLKRRRSESWRRYVEENHPEWL